MYVTRPRSVYLKDPSALSEQPPEGPYTGFLVMQDEEAESRCCFGMCKKDNITRNPFPQNMDLTVNFTQKAGGSVIVFEDKVIFVPVLNMPLSSNRYYVIGRSGKHRGEASTSSKEDEKGTCLCFSYIKDVKPKPLDSSNAHQVFEVMRKRYGFHAKSVSEDGFPPLFLRRKGWEVYAKTPRHYRLDEALGLNPSLRAQLPDFNFPLSQDRSEPVVVGKWYVPFMFVKEQMKLSDQMEKSVFYCMTLQRRWEKVFSKGNSNNIEENAESVDVDIAREFVMVGGKEAVLSGGGDDDGVLWWKSDGGKMKVGLSVAVYEQMKWEEERGGWEGGKERDVRLNMEEKLEGTLGWRNVGWYVLVESFVLNRMEGSLVLSYDFRHTHQIRCKWE